MKKILTIIIALLIFFNTSDLYSDWEKADFKDRFENYTEDYVAIRSISGFISTPFKTNSEWKVLRYSPYNEDFRLSLIKDEKSEEFFRRIKAILNDYFTKREVSHYGPDSSYIEIEIMLEGEKYRFASWHPLYRNHKNNVATSRGIVSFDGEERKKEILRNDTEEFKNFVKGFDSIVALTLSFSKGQLGESNTFFVEQETEK